MPLECMEYVRRVNEAVHVHHEAWDGLMTHQGVCFGVGHLKVPAYFPRCAHFLSSMPLSTCNSFPKQGEKGTI